MQMKEVRMQTNLYHAETCRVCKVSAESSGWRTDDSGSARFRYGSQVESIQVAPQSLQCLRVQFIHGSQGSPGGEIDVLTDKPDRAVSHSHVQAPLMRAAEGIIAVAPFVWCKRDDAVFDGFKGRDKRRSKPSVQNAWRRATTSWLSIKVTVPE